MQPAASGDSLLRCAGAHMDAERFLIRYNGPPGSDSARLRMGRESEDLQRAWCAVPTTSLSVADEVIQ